MLRNIQFWPLVLSFLLLMVTAQKGIADAGNCVKYEVAIQLMNGQQVTGFVFVVNYDPKFQFKDVPFLEYEGRYNPSDTLRVYTNIRQLKFPTVEKQNFVCKFLFDATTAAECVLIIKKSIRAIKILSYTTCSNCGVKNEQNGFYWHGLSPMVITELTKSEIDLLQKRPAAELAFYHDTENSNIEYWMISYSSNYDLTRLEKVKSEFLTKTNRLLREGGGDSIQMEYRELKRLLRQANVVIFKVKFLAN